LCAINDVAEALRCALRLAVYDRPEMVKSISWNYRVRGWLDL